VVSFVQRFGSALQLNVHFHVLVSEGLFAAPSPGAAPPRATFLALPPPSDEEVDSLLQTVMHRVVRLLGCRGLLEEGRLPRRCA
jgi:Putative transposase